MNKRTIDQILDAIASDFIPDQVDLTPRIMEKIHHENRTLRRIRVSSYALLLVTLLIMVLIFRVPGMASAMRQLFSFVPGVGMVDRSAPVRVLQESVSQEHHGVTVTIEQVIALAERTIIQYKVSGIPSSAYPKPLPGSESQERQNMCIDPLFLRLPDGSVLTYTGYNVSFGTENVPEYEASFTVKPVPRDIDEVTLVMPCIEGIERDVFPGAWELPLRLVPATGQVTLLPVYDLLTPTSVPAETRTEPASAQPANDVRKTPEGDIQLTLDQVVLLQDGDQFYGSLRWDANRPYSVVSIDSFEMTDSQGQRIPLMQISPDLKMMPLPDSHFVPLAFKVTGPVQQPGPLTLTVDRLSASLPVRDARFIFDSGTDPHENQRWILHHDIQVGEYTLRVESVTRLADGYEFSIQPGSGVGCVDLYIQGFNQLGGECGQGVTKVLFDEEVPSGVMTVVIANLEVHLTGTWQATWLPPEVGQDKVSKP